MSRRLDDGAKLEREGGDRGRCCSQRAGYEMVSHVGAAFQRPQRCDTQQRELAVIRLAAEPLEEPKAGYWRRTKTLLASVLRPLANRSFAGLQSACLAAWLPISVVLG